MTEYRIGPHTVYDMTPLKKGGGISSSNVEE